MTVKHPCFSCTLPDCDERSAYCNLRKSLNTYDRNRRAGRPVSDELRQCANIAWNEFYGIARRERERCRRDAEAQS
ncbi:hypothetical protein [Martelella mediterranea]|uniref:Uncharacterized protein n=1 Tax=Martelella mediterranea TaxID=293089 RepID=A0A4R3NQM1_9HYPH|nr:hypothetical protein [Martelella mediterranea]TCT37457.1 hypothetical protein EDC90_101834 [Martelella mediterranea]